MLDTGINREKERAVPCCPQHRGQKSRGSSGGMQRVKAAEFTEYLTPRSTERRNALYHAARYTKVTRAEGEMRGIKCVMVSDMGIWIGWCNMEH